MGHTMSIVAGSLSPSLRRPECPQAAVRSLNAPLRPALASSVRHTQGLALPRPLLVGWEGSGLWLPTRPTATIRNALVWLALDSCVRLSEGASRGLGLWSAGKPCKGRGSRFDPGLHAQTAQRRSRQRHLSAVECQPPLASVPARSLPGRSIATPDPRQR